MSAATVIAAATTNRELCVKCPKCGAPQLSPCRTSSDSLASQPHRDRIRLALRRALDDFRRRRTEIERQSRAMGGE